jgi:exopolyphosphatase/guanosine-5'-triphosphate,3'-diphosphate pyrophosphatase
MRRAGADVRSAILDLGSNSFHVLVADVDGRDVVPVLRDREMLHLGRVVATHGHIPDGDRAAARAVVAHLADRARRAGAEEVTAVATAAIRDAEDGAAVLAELSEAAGTEVEVLDGVEEARLAYLGVRAAVAVRREPVLVLDLGGGSLELAVGIGDQVQWSTSLPLGVSRLSASVTADPPKRREVRALRDTVDQALEPVVDRVAGLGPQGCVAVGGTVRALARVVAATEGRWLPATVNQFEVPLPALDRLRDRLVSIDTVTRGRLPGMKSRRADHLHVAAVILTRVLERLGLAATTVSDWGLREGLLLERHAVSSAPSALELTAAQVAGLRRRFVPDDAHPIHVAHLAGLLFDGTRPLHGLGSQDRDLLRHAAELHTVGESLALRRSQVHGAYLIENAELRGFTPDELAMLVTLVRFHPSRGIASDHAAFASLSTADKARTERLLALLHVADALDRSRDQAVTGLQVDLGEDVVELLPSGGPVAITEAELERRTRLFSRVFDVDVTLREPEAA